jgi:hypothetical protein
MTMKTTTANNKIDTTLTHPYRTSELVPVCVVVGCNDSALLRCPVCDRPFCGGHASVSSSCPDCELELSKRVDRANNIAMLVYAAGLAASAGIIGLADWYLGVTAAGFGLLGGTLFCALARRLARRKAHRSWIPIENATLQVGADAGLPRVRRLGRLVASKSRETDMYTAAYNAGFNRVQGCA